MGGIFVTKRIQALRKLGVEVMPYIYYMEYSKAAQRYLEKVSHMETQSAPIDRQEDIRYKLRGVRQGFLELAAASLRPKWNGIRFARQLKRDMDAEGGADLIHLHWFWPLGAGVYRYCRKYKVPYVITCHGSDINVNMAEPKLRESIKKILEGAAAVEFVSQALLDRAKELGYSGKNAEIVYNGIEGSIFNENAGEKTSMPLVGFVGNLIPVKGADRIPKIFENIYEKMGHQVTFSVTGDGALREKLQQEMKELPVVFTGQLGQKALAEQYSRMSVLVAPSRREGYSCVIKEAQACGVIPVGIHTGGIPEAVAGYGSTIEEQKTEEALAEKLADAAVQYLKQEKKINLQEMIEKASMQTWEETQKKSLWIYQKLLEKQEQ